MQEEQKRKPGVGRGLLLLTGKETKNVPDVSPFSRESASDATSFPYTSCVVRSVAGPTSHMN